MKVVSCGKCDEHGFLMDSYGFRTIPCDCLLKARSLNRLKSCGFNDNTLSFVSSEKYTFPEVSDNDMKYVNFLIENPEIFEEKGLNLYIWSEERGRGKTTLAHYLMYVSSKYFYDPLKYSSDRAFAFHHVDDFLKSMKDSEDDSWKSTWFVLDDLGNEDSSADWKKGFTRSAMQKMLHFRRDNGLPTIITSNRSPSALSAFYSGLLDSLLEIQPDGSLGGLTFRSVQITTSIDYRLNNDITKWDV